MKRDKYTFLELMNDIDDELIDRAMNQEATPNRLFYHVGRKIACAAVIVLAVFSCLFRSQVEAAISRLTTRIAQFWDVDKDLTPYTDVINTSRSKDGFTLTINEVILSENQLVIAADLESDYPEQLLEFPGYIMIDGKKCLVPDVSYETNEAVMETEAGEGSDDGQTIITCTLEDGVIPRHAVKIGISLIACRNWEDAEKLWHLKTDLRDGDPVPEDIGTLFKFEFRASGEEMGKKAVSKELNQEISADGGWNIRLENITLNDIYSRITAELKNSTIAEEDFKSLAAMVPEFYLEGTDSLGNYVLYWLYSASSSDNCTWNAEFAAELRGDELPSTESEWIDLRLFTWKGMGEPDTEYETAGQEDTAYMEDKNVRNLETKVYLGEKFRIYLN